MATIQGVYLALFGRPADPLGLSYFNSVTSNGQNLNAIAPLSATPEFQARFAGQSNVQIINSIYQSLFNRAADLPGLTYFSNELAAGRLNINNVAIAIYDGAQGADLTIRNLKEAAANAFTAAVDTAPEVLGYQGAAAAASGAAFIAGVTTTAPTAAQVDAAVLAATSGTNSTVTINLTTAIAEQVNGTAANETINAVLDAANPSANTGTFNTADVINGGAGTDTLNVTVTTGGALPAGASVSNVEIVNINQTTAALTGVSSASFAGVQQLWQIDSAIGGGATQNVSIGSGVTAGFRGAGDVLATTVTALAGNSSVAIALDGVTTGGTIAIAEASAGLVKTVSISGSVATTGGLIVDGGGATTAVDTYNVSLSSTGTVFLGTDAAVVKAVNFGGSTGGITYDSSALTTAFTTLTGGSGRDNLTASNATANAATLVVNAGAGNDTINFNNGASAAAGASTLTGGAGGDTFVLTGAGNLLTAASAANLTANLTTITDFSAAEDILNINGLGLGARAVQNAVNAAVAGAADIFVATTAAAAQAGAGGYAIFQFGADTYIFDNNGAAALDAGDTLIQLTGVTVGQLTAANFIA